MNRSAALTNMTTDTRFTERDIKPDNILLDEHGHAHLTDFNIAAIVKDDLKATSIAGTKPYMAPELFQTSEGTHPGYSFAVDWWSLGITAYELLRGQHDMTMPLCTKPLSSMKTCCALVGAEELESPAQRVLPDSDSAPLNTFGMNWNTDCTQTLPNLEKDVQKTQRPYIMRSNTPTSEILQSFHKVHPCYPAAWSAEIKSLLQKLLCVDAQKRLSSFSELKDNECLSNVNWVAVLSKNVPPSFIPNRRRLNCDPTFELEEMILESKPLHKKKKRLARKTKDPGSDGSPQNCQLQQRLDCVQRDFLVFNREKLTKAETDSSNMNLKEEKRTLEDGQNNNLNSAAASTEL